METAKTFVKNYRLRQERIGHDWRQRDLAELVGTTVVTVRRWERGSHQPSAYFQAKLCALFGKSAEQLGLCGEGSAKSLSLWTIPSPRNPNFTGRDELLERLAQHLSPLRSEEPTITRPAVLTQSEAIKGLGGMGKTQIAIEYAYRARERDRYTHTLWIHAADQEAILSSFATLAQQLPEIAAKEEKDQHQLVAAIIDWLEQCQESWLLIFDNANDLALVHRYIPRQGKGSVLLTTRAQAVTALALPLNVETMGIMEGAHFLLHRTQRLNATDEERNEAANVVMALDGFPLALDQAGAYMEETGCSFGDYLRLHHEYYHALLARRGMQATQYPDSVTTTWDISFQKVEQANPAAADLLRLCAFLVPDHIPEDILREAASHCSPALQEAVSDLWAFNQMLEALLKFSLVKRLPEEHALSIHRLVQVVQRERMNPQEQERWARYVVSGVNAVFPRNPKDEIATWPQCQRYLEQVQSCDLLIQQYGLRFSEAADLLNRAGIYLCEQALYALAEPLHRRALSIWQQLLGQEHPQVASALNSLANLYWDQGKYEQAEPLVMRALAIREQMLGTRHPATAQSLNNLACLYFAQGKYEQAEPLYLRALAIREQMLGAEHPTTAQSLNNLAELYQARGKYGQAEPIYQRALSILEQKGLSSHPEEIADVMYAFARFQAAQGNNDEASTHYEQALSVREQFSGLFHPKTREICTGLIALLQAIQLHEEAARLALRSLMTIADGISWEYHR